MDKEGEVGGGGTSRCRGPGSRPRCPAGTEREVQKRDHSRLGSDSPEPNLRGEPGDGINTESLPQGNGKGFGGAKQDSNRRKEGCDFRGGLGRGLIWKGPPALPRKDDEGGGNFQALVSLTLWGKAALAFQGHWSENSRRWSG